MDLILCEDTRVTRKLLSAHGIEGKTLMRLNEHSPAAIDRLIETMAGKTIALVSDSGTPGISDPGARFIERLSRCAQFKIIPIPGPSAAAAIMSASGLGRDGFVFLGFLPRAPRKIRKQLAACRSDRKAVVFYESPHRLTATIGLIAEAWPQSQLVIGRELTKEYEEIIRGRAADVGRALEHKGKILGEITVVWEHGGKTQNSSA